MRTHDLPSHNHATAFVWGTVHGKEGGVAIPTTNGGVQRTEAQSEHVHVARTVFFFFARAGADLHAQSVLVDKTPASELRRKFVKSELLVGTPHGAEGRGKEEVG